MPNRKPSATSSEDAIRVMAYQLWEAEGRPFGKADDHWLRAMELTRGESQPVRKAPAKRSRKADA